jgi:hypothetical protein
LDLLAPLALLVLMELKVLPVPLALLVQPVLKDLLA